MPKKGPSNTVFNRTRTRLFKHLPGAKGEKYRRKAFAFRQMECQAEFERVLERLDGGLCVDLGANVGTYTRRMAARAARVVAFEPDPWTATELRSRLGDLDNVEVIEAAAGTEEGQIEMYRAVGYSDDPLRASESTSVFADKSNVDTAHAITVRQIDFPAWLAAQDAPVELLKIDIEGAEVPLLEALLDHPARDRVEMIFCETHESRLPALAARTKALRRRAARIARPRINLDWV
jgi:FkbM family methyltransferase